jgi:hypothetical protein
MDMVTGIAEITVPIVTGITSATAATIEVVRTTTITGIGTAPAATTMAMEIGRITETATAEMGGRVV